MDLLDKILNEVKQDKDVKDKDGTQPAKYYAGDMSKSTKDKRDAHFKAKKSGPAPGDHDAKTKKSKHTMKFDRMFNEDKGLDAKAKKSGISKSILKKVYDRGLAAFKTGHRPGATAPQWAMARVNSFITKGSGTWGGADKDLAKQAGGKSESINENVAVKQAELKAKQVEEMEALKEKQAKELEALKSRHERDNEKIAKEKEGESQRDNLSNESVEEGKLVDSMGNIVDVIFKKIKSKIEKDYSRNPESTLGVINTLGAMVGHKVTDKSQAKGKLFLKFGEELEVIGEQDECWNGYTQKGMKKKGDKMVPNCVPEEIEERHSDVMRKRNQSQQKAHQKAMMKSAKKSIKDYDARNKNKNEETEVEEDRDYKKEYENYHSDPKQIKRRAKRNEARRSLKNSKKLTADKDVHHKDNNPMNNDKSNLSIVSKNYNRKEPRMRDKLKEKGCLPNGKRK